MSWGKPPNFWQLSVLARIYVDFSNDLEPHMAFTMARHFASLDGDE